MRPIVATLLGAALLAAGCGGSSNTEPRATPPVRPGSSTGPLSRSEYVTQVDRLLRPLRRAPATTSVSRAADGLSAIEPPTAVTRVHARLVAALREAANELAQGTARASAKGLAKADRALAALDARGYRVVRLR